MKATLILLLVFITISLTAQHSYISSERTLTTKDGLASNTVLSIHKDATGFIWIGTDKGLNRFDGQYFEHFSSASHPDMTVDAIHEIFEDETGYLWLLEANKPFEKAYRHPKINLYNIYTKEWTTLEERFGDSLPFDVAHISYMKELSDGSIFIFCEEMRKSFLYQSVDGFKTLSIAKNLFAISDFSHLKDGNYMFYGHILGDDTDNFSHFYNFTINPQGKVLKKTKANHLLSVYDDNRTYQFQLEKRDLQTDMHNLDAFKVLNNHLEPIDTYNSSIEIVSHSKWNKEQELLWIKSQNSIKAVMPSGKVVYQYSTAFDITSLPILFDGNRTWWSNKREGIVVTTLEPNYFQTHQFFKETFDNSTRGIYVHQDGRKWVSTLNGEVIYRSQGSF